MRDLTSLLTLMLLLAHVAPTCGDWFYDFDDGVVPETFVALGHNQWSGAHTDTLQASAEGGEFRMWDTIPSQNGGTSGAHGFDPEIFEGDVRVSADINTRGDSDEFVGLVARVTDPIATSNLPYYWTSINFNENDGRYLRLSVGKALPDYTGAYVESSWQIPYGNQSYFMEMDVIDDPIEGFPVVSGRVYGEEGGTLIAEVSMTDSSVGQWPAATSGRAGVGAWAFGSIMVDTSFDNIRAEALTPYLLGDMNLDGAVNGLDIDQFVEAVVGGATQSASPFLAAVLGSGTQPVPEPSTLLLALVALGVVGGWRKWGG